MGLHELQKVGQHDIQEVYVMQRGFGIKIGIAKTVGIRYNTFKTASPSPVFVLGVVIDGGPELEQKLHKHFDKCHVVHPLVGTEWFYPDIKIILWLYRQGFAPIWTPEFLLGALLYHLRIHRWFIGLRE